MKILWNGFLGRSHSWSIVSQNLCREFIRMGHHVDMFSTNGNLYFPEDLKPNLIGFIEEDKPEKVFGKIPEVSYDAQLSYTVFKNFSKFFNRGSKNRFGIWSYETTILPKGFVKHTNFVDKVLPPSNFAKDIFTNNGVDEKKQVVIPHGIHLDRFQNLGKYPLKTKKKYKILCNIAQPHLRKNIPGLLKTYGKAFTKSDDVCLIFKIAKSGANPKMDISIFNDVYKDFEREFKNHGEIEVISQFLTDIEPLYNACDIILTMSHAECFYIPGLEGMAANKIVIAPRYGGQLDFMNDENSILIGGKEIRADNRMQYWEPSPYAKVFDPNVDEAAEKLKDIVKNYGDYSNKFVPKMQEMVPEWTWAKAAEKIMNLMT